MKKTPILRDIQRKKNYSKKTPFDQHCDCLLYGTRQRKKNVKKIIKKTRF